MINSSIKEIVKEAKELHPDVPDVVVNELSNFLVSELNKNELNSVSLKQVTADLLNALVKSIEKSEN